MGWLHWRHLPLSTPQPPQVAKMTLVYQVRERRASPQRTFRSSSLRSILKTCPNGPKSFRTFYSSPDSNTLMSGPSAHSSGSRAEKKFLQRQVKNATRKSSSWGDFLKRLEQMYPVYETDLSVRTEIEELPPLPEFPTAARISEFVAQELMGRMDPSSYGPTEPHLWLVGKIPPTTWENCKKTSERKSRSHSYDELADLLIELAMERENDSHMDKYLRKHLRREAPAEEAQGGRSPQPHSNPGKGKGGQLKHMKETPPAKGKGAPNLFYCQPTDDKGGPCHAPDCDGRSSCMLQLQRKQKTKIGQGVKHQDHFCCTITCGYCGKRRHYEDECHIKRRESEKIKKAEEERRKNAGKGGGRSYPPGNPR